MSKKTIAALERQGMSTPQTLPTARCTVKEFIRAVEDSAIMPLAAASDQLCDLAILFNIIGDLAERGRAASQIETPGYFERIAALARTAASQADDVGLYVDSAHGEMRDEHLPRLLATLPNGGEA